MGMFRQLRRGELGIELRAPQRLASWVEGGQIVLLRDTLTRFVAIWAEELVDLGAECGVIAVSFRADEAIPFRRVERRTWVYWSFTPSAEHLRVFAAVDARYDQRTQLVDGVDTSKALRSKAYWASFIACLEGGFDRSDSSTCEVTFSAYEFICAVVLDGKREQVLDVYWVQVETEISSPRVRRRGHQLIEITSKRFSGEADPLAMGEHLRRLVSPGWVIAIRPQVRCRDPLPHPHPQFVDHA
jgi:hypothetical protein